MKAHKLPRFSVEEYVQQEIDSNTKYEYHDGKIYALVGRTINHGLICGNVYSELRNELKTKGSNCLPFTSEVKLYIEKTNSYVYPDSMVICGEIESAKNEKNAVVNPELIIEVLSDSTAEYDRGDKFFLYGQIPGFREYVLIEQKRYVVDVHFKSNESDLWKITRYEGLDKIVKLQSIGVAIKMEDLYYRTEIDLPE